MMNPGKLNKRIKIISDSDGATDDEGFPISGASVIKETWSEVRGLRGREMYQSASFQAEINKVFTFRYFEELEHSMSIEYRNTKYNIVSIENLNEEDRFYKVYASVVKPSE